MIALLRRAKITYATFFLLLLPIVFGIVGVSFNYVRFANDPNYIYLMNGLNIIKWQPVGHVDNPGTPVMELCAAVISVSQLISPVPSGDIVQDVLNDPERYMGIIRVVLVLLGALAIFFAGCVVYRSTKDLFAALLVQITPFLSVTLMDVAWSKVSPEPLLFFTAILFSALLVKQYSDENLKPGKYVWLYALLAGFGLATKATFLPLLIIPLWVLPGWAPKFRYFILTIISFFIFIIPAIPAFIYMIGWFQNLITHSGIYGQGDQNFVDAAAYTRALRDIFINNKIFSLITLLSVLYIPAALLITGLRSRMRSKPLSFLTAILLANLLSVIIVAKHYHQNHYLLPILALSGVSVYFLVINLSTLFAWKHLLRSLQISFLVLFAGLILFRYVPAMKKFNYWYKATNQETESVNENIAGNFSNHKKIYYFPNSINVYSALAFGNAYSASRNLTEIKAQYPDILLYNSFERTINFWGAELSLNTVISEFGEDILFLCPALSQSEVDEISKSVMPLQNVYKGFNHTLFVLDKNALATGLFRMNGDFAQVQYCDLESLTEDQQNFLCGNYLISTAGAITSEVTRSGKNAVKLSGTNEFSLGVVLNEIQPGKRYRISLWRLSDNNDGVVVAASEPEKFFYRQMGDFLKTDEKGWKLIELSFTIPEDIGSNQVKVYVWNTGKGVVYFDDLTISSD